MKTLIRLSDLGHIPSPTSDEYSPELVEQARAALVKTGLRWCNKTGKVYDNRMLLEEFVNPSDHEPHDTEQDVMDWEFSRKIFNACSRKMRGYSFI